MDDEQTELLRQIAKDVAAIKAALGAGAASAASALGVAIGGSSAGGGAVGTVASSTELDSQYGDEAVKFIPRDWSGDGVAKGQPFSECPPEFLDLLAAAYEHYAKKNDKNGTKDAKGRPKSSWDWKSARLARGWAARKRAGWKPPSGAAGGGAPVSDDDYGPSGDDEIPFIVDATTHNRWDRP